jgi:hypothetical protein
MEKLQNEKFHNLSSTKHQIKWMDEMDCGCYMPTEMRNTEKISGEKSDREGYLQYLGIHERPIIQRRQCTRNTG